MPSYTLLIGPLCLGLSWLLYRAAFLVAASRANKNDLPAIVRAMKGMPSPHNEDNQKGPPSLPRP